jgi:hypothetical protein
VNWIERKEYPHRDFNHHHFLYDDHVIYTNDQNKKPEWITQHAENSEFYIKRNKDELLIVVGESWAYGESLPNVATAIGKYDLFSQLENCFSARMANAMNADLYQYAVPGNCNYYMFKELERILPYVKSMNYKKVHLCIQMTEPGRESAISDLIVNHPLTSLLDFKVSCEFTDWLEQYDEVFFKYLNNILVDYGIGIDCVLWKNFCSINTDTRYDSFKVEETSWIQYSSRMSGDPMPAPSFYSIGWVDNFIKKYGNIKFNPSYLNQQIDLIEKSNNYLTGHPMHYPHPNQMMHLLWAQYLARSSGWVTGI